MKTLLLSSALATGIIAAGPAFADFNSTGDGIFGHDYRMERIVKSDPRDLASGYTDAVSQERTGSVKAVAEQARGDRTREAAPRARMKSVRDERTDIRR